MINRVFFILSFWCSVVVTFISADNLCNKKDYKGFAVCFLVSLLFYYGSMKFRDSWLNSDKIDE